MLVHFSINLVKIVEVLLRKKLKQPTLWNGGVICLDLRGCIQMKPKDTAGHVPQYNCRGMPRKMFGRNN